MMLGCGGSCGTRKGCIFAQRRNCKRWRPLNLFRKRLQKRPKTEGEKGADVGRNGLRQDMQFCKKGQRRRQLRMFAVRKEPSNFTMGDWQQMTEEGRSAKD